MTALKEATAAIAERAESAGIVGVQQTPIEEWGGLFIGSSVSLRDVFAAAAEAKQSAAQTIEAADGPVDALALVGGAWITGLATGLLTAELERRRTPPLPVPVELEASQVAALYHLHGAGDKHRLTVTPLPSGALLVERPDGRRWTIDDAGATTRLEEAVDNGA